MNTAAGPLVQWGFVIVQQFVTDQSKYTNDLLSQLSQR